MVSPFKMVLFGPLFMASKKTSKNDGKLGDGLDGTLSSHKPNVWLLASTPLKNMLVSWGYYSQYMEK